MTEPSCFLIDLDDTLFPELTYVDSGYRAIAPKLANLCDAEIAEVLFRLRYELRKFGRVGVFDRVLAHFGKNSSGVADLVAAYRGHEPDIQFYPGAREGLVMLRRIAPVAIITDGNAGMQRRKIEALKLNSEVDEIVFCSECAAPKPATLAYKIAVERIGGTLKKAVVIGDDPLHDMAAAKAVGARRVRVRTGRLSDLGGDEAEEYPDFAAAVAALTGT